MEWKSNCSIAFVTPFARVTTAGGLKEAYVYWIRRYIVFHKKTHPSTMGASEVTAFLTWLAVDQRVSASTQRYTEVAIDVIRIISARAATAHERTFYEEDPDHRA